MKAEKVPPLLFAVLVPHRGCLLALEEYRRDLFTKGFEGAFSFPSAAPLALLKRPLNSGELKKAAAELGKNLEGKKIVCSGFSEYSVQTESLTTPVTIRFFGAVLELPLPFFPEDAVLHIWEKPVLAPAIIAPGKLGLTEKFVTSRSALAFSPVSMKRYENAAIRKVSEQVFQTIQTPPIPQEALPEFAGIKSPVLVSRAAALANLALYPVPGMEYSFTWELGYPYWLPRGQ